MYFFNFEMIIHIRRKYYIKFIFEYINGYVFCKLIFYITERNHCSLRELLVKNEFLYT